MLKMLAGRRSFPFGSRYIFQGRTVKLQEFMPPNLPPHHHIDSFVIFVFVCRRDIVVVNEEVVLRAHAAQELGHVVSKQKGCLLPGTILDGLDVFAFEHLCSIHRIQFKPH